MKSHDIDYDHLPDACTLRGDLVAIIKPHSIETVKGKLEVMAGVVSCFRVHRNLRMPPMPRWSNRVRG